MHVIKNNVKGECECYVNIAGDFKRPTRELIVEYAKLSTPTIDESFNRRGAMDPTIQTIKNGLKLCGPAFTVKCHVGDNLTLIKAIDLAQKGDVLVVDIGNVCDSSPWGEITTTACVEKGIMGLVINASVRDIAILRKIEFPVFSKGVCIKGTTKNYFGFINYPICCGGIIVNPGDIVVGDDDGVVVVNLGEAEDTLKKAYERDKKEEELIMQLKQGKSLWDIAGFKQKYEY